MPTSLVALLILLRSFIRSRVDLQLEKLALPSNRRASTPAEETPENSRNGPPLLGFSVVYTARLALGISHRQAANGCGLASHGLSLVLDLEGSKSARLLRVASPADLQPKAVGNNTALDLPGFRFPKLR